MALLEMQDYKTTVSIKPTKSVVRERLGMPILLNTTGGTTQLPSPNPQDSVYSIDGTGLLGLFTTPAPPQHPTGTDYWLVVSWFWIDDNLLIEDHDHALGTEVGHECRWLGHPVRIKSMWDHSQHRMVEVYVNKTTMAELFEPYGGTLGSAKWLAGRLLPRRLSAALRLVNHDHLQLWFKL